MGYGTGAIMAVPAHDERDWEFARQYHLPIREVIAGGNVKEAAFVDDRSRDGRELRTRDRSFSINGLHTVEAIPKITAWLAKQGKGLEAINYKLRDWLFARQRYWGEPFPVVWVDGEAASAAGGAVAARAAGDSTILNRPGRARARWPT